MTDHEKRSIEADRDAVYRFLLRSGADTELAADLCQETFVRAISSDSRPTDALERPWLFRIARNLLIDNWRQAKRRGGSSLMPLHANENARQPLKAILEQELKALPAREREAVLMRELGGFSYAQIGVAASTTEATVRSRIYRARKKLRKSLLNSPDYDPTNKEEIDHG